ncbi:MAG: hypothetical protein IJW13_00695 [Clostridia bacterium]|nr:hypothetical protein [Clostridia bacterium]
MKKRTKILAGIIAAAVIASTSILVVSCSNKNKNTTDFNSAFNHFAIGGLSLLSSYSGEASTLANKRQNGAITQLTAASNELSASEKQQMLKNLAIAANMLNGDMVQSEAGEPDRVEYQRYYLVTAKDLNGENKVYKFYYNSEKTSDKNHLLNSESVERIEGIVVYNQIEYEVIGERELEEGEEETNFTVKLDQSNYVTIEQETENNEKEYSYTAYQNGVKVFESSVEYQAYKSGRVELTFEREQKGEEIEYNFEFYQENSQSFVRVKYKKESTGKGYGEMAIIQVLTDNFGNVTYQFVKN